MTSEEIRKKFLEFFRVREHTVVPSSSLIPDDPSVLLTTAGMQQFKRYFTGELDAKKDFGSLNTASIQKCFRTSDIDEVGDASHLTFFEMLGNFSFGGYFKEKAIEYGYEFITKDLGIAPDRISVSVFKGDSSTGSTSSLQAGSGQVIPRDDESFGIWHEKIGISKNKIGENGREDNFWGPTGSEGPCGPTSEIYVDGLEVWNLVFNEYYQKPDKTLEKLETLGVDTGMGLERLAMVVQNVPTIFETDLFQPLIQFLPANLSERMRRILTDHMRGIAFLISDGVWPSNKEAGYILRRLIRRLVTHLHLAGDTVDQTQIFVEVINLYGSFYPELNLNKERILEVFKEERARFKFTLQVGLKELNRVTSLDAKSAFKLYESYGLPYEILKELGGDKAIKLTREAFDEEFSKHKIISRMGAVKKFGGHGLILNTGELKAGDEAELKKVTRLHTATHLLHRALRQVLGDDVHQMGSDITTERTRFDFSFNRKMTPEELKKVEVIVNEKVKEELPVKFEEMTKEEAEKTGALHFFKEKYPEKVKVYYVGDSLKTAWSKEFCGGPHVTHTGEIGKIRILKEEAVGAGVRRLRATVE
ncbi:MAG: Alanine-tRNA ligase [Candidatus Jorgensenbacteria bacterium GW2011_GWA1_48_11]|uniref:alanine--tRNA ligase n=1 Tax=Candidatus Jorgensenbacteria bacterium GW2011_GWA1_48_11 TaxID=1618660 RepID=A0A0G1UAP8_9BACT|nr:MAG: Alanine-tRNA ligase [Candidatus Jorgensenbacteria bacterium GW2011_GWA1_48_11]KKW11858.1 MAG: Alanine-tRNA ligase [Candidatus Jorgensenbacteria bacterium GW2011_GWB1_49_9]